LDGIIRQRILDTMRCKLALSLAVAGLLGVSSAARADVQLTIHDGQVSLNATNATVRQILEQWARVGQTKIVNVERITGAPVTMQLVNMPEQQALDIILRSVSGYLAAPRAQMAPQVSRFDRIVVLPTSTPRNVPAPPPTFQQPQFTQPPTPDDDDDDEPAPNVVMPNPRGPIFNTFPQPQPGYQPPGVVNQQPMPPGATPPQPQQPPTTYQPQTSPVGVAVPGMIVQPPQQPGQVPGQPPPGDREP
jgi:hypothetical protein